MRGILGVDIVCLREIFKFLTLLDLCELRQSCTQIKFFVEDYSCSLYFARAQWLDLRQANIRNVHKVLKNFGKFIRRLKIGEKTIELNLLLDVIASNCDVLKCLTLDSLQLHKIDIKKFAVVFSNLEILEFISCHCDENFFESVLLEPEYPILKEVRIKNTYVKPEIIQQFFMRPRHIKKLNCWYINGDTLPLIALNASDIEELIIYQEDVSNLMYLAQLKKLKRLEIYCRPMSSIVEVIKELSVNSELETLGLYLFEFSDEFYGALSNLTSLKKLQLWCGEFTIKDLTSIEMLGQKLSNFESLMLASYRNFPYRKFLASACKSYTFRTVYVSIHNDFRDINNFIEELVKDFSDGNSHRCFVSGNPLCIYIHARSFNNMERLLTKDNLQSIEKYGNIKIHRAIAGTNGFAMDLF